MEAAQEIREAVAQVTHLREAARAQPGLGAAVMAVKRLQHQRFAGTYADLLADPRHQQAARFFLDELYGCDDFSERDAQFSRIAGALERLFPAHVVATAVSLARLHVLTEQLDHDLAVQWERLTDDPAASEAARYTTAWRAVDRRPERGTQLEVVMAIGSELERLTRMPGLRMALRLMRKPAAAAGLAALQAFLEAGFDTFAVLARQPDGARIFLDTIRTRESAWIDRLFDADFVACETQLAQTLGQAR
ncbi:MAG: hypothetical protein CVU30_08510 [Betaproteobacteria bacterium HGW-Betaproteobacteria-3]|jgi:hypothetical protein|nr:MAG: hypothetical protein CVU30_08510 [Betaproteobacteria bacterium HGW-Betaproteobacteria-3]